MTGQTNIIGQARTRRGAVIVTRVSTGEQVKHGTSLESQLELCRAKAAALGLTVVAAYEDAGISGGLLQMRAGMQAAIADITASRASHLICATLDRFSRTVEHQHAIKREIETAGGTVVFCDMDFDDTPEGDLNFAIQGGFKQYERQAIRARTMRGKRKRAESGQQPQRSRPPFGYLIVTHADVTRGTYPPDQLGQYFVVEEKAAIIRRLFESYAAGTHSMPALARVLNQEGVPTPGGGRAWLEPTLRVILTNPVYKGEPACGKQRTVVDENRLQQVHRLNGRPITRPEMRVARPQEEWVQLSAPPLVTADIWQAAQERMAQMRTFQGGNPRRTHMLSGKVYCPHCGSQAVIKHQKANGVSYRYYLCGAQRRSRVLGPERPCVGDLYPIHETEQAALTALKKVLTCPASVTEALAVYRQGQIATSLTPDEVRRHLRDLDAGLLLMKGEEQSAVTAQLAGIRAGASPEAYAAVFADIAARRKDLEGKRRALSGSPGRPKAGKTDDGIMTGLLQSALAVLSDPAVPGSEKRTALSPIVERVICRKGGADVVFAQGLFDEPWGKDNNIWSKDGPGKNPTSYDNSLGGEENTRQTYQTTCMGMRTQR